MSKIRDSLPPELTKVPATSKGPCGEGLHEYDANTNCTSASTVGHKYQNSLDSLAETLDKSVAVFVWCIKSRHAKAPKCAGRCRHQVSARLGDEAVRPLMYESYGRLGHAGTELLRDLVTAAAGDGNCSPHAVGRWRNHLERVLLSAEADTFLRALGSRAAATGQPAALSPPKQDK